MNPMLVQLLQVGIGIGIGILVKHLWPASPGVPTSPSSPVSPATPVVDPFKVLPGLPGHPLLNSPLTQLFLQQVEQALLASLQGTATNMVSPVNLLPKA